MAAVVADLEATGLLPAWLRPVVLAADPAAVATCHGAMLDWPGVLEELQRTRVPTLVLAGDQDPGLADLRATADSSCLLGEGSGRALGRPSAAISA